MRYLLTGGLLMAIVSGCNTDGVEVKRFGSVIEVKEEKLEYYKKLHADPWPGVLEELTKANIRNFSIYLKKMDDGKHYLFSYFEYTGTDQDADFKRMAEAEIIRKWWKETDPCQIPIKNRKEGEHWAAMEEVYHSD